MADNEVKLVVEAKAEAVAEAGVEAVADTRYSFTPQFLMAAHLQAKAAAEIETILETEITEREKVMHRGYVVGAIMQSCAALEAEIWELVNHGPGHHLGSDKTDQAAKNFLAPLVELIEKQETLSRYEIMLHLLRKTPLPHGEQPSQDASLVVRLRNELVHYKSRWGEDLERQKLFVALQQKNHPKPPFISDNVNFFPHECLSAACACWAVSSIVKFIDKFYDRLGIQTPLSGYRDRLPPN